MRNELSLQSEIVALEKRVAELETVVGELKAVIRDLESQMAVDLQALVTGATIQ